MTVFNWSQRNRFFWRFFRTKMIWNWYFSDWSVFVYTISSILFFIYIRFLFSKIQIKIQINFFNFIDDIQINVSSKNIDNNCKTLIKIIKIAFSWINANAIQFDDSKFELIHFESKKIMSTNSITVSNGTILKSQNMIK